MKRWLGPLLLGAVVLSSCSSVPVRDPFPGEDVPPPIPWNRVPPHPPEALLVDRVETSITVDMMIEGDGSVSEVRVLDEAHPGLFREAVVRFVSDWEYKAPVVDGVRVRRRSEPITIRTFFHPCPEPAPHGSEFMDICIRVVEEDP